MQCQVSINPHRYKSPLQSYEHGDVLSLFIEDIDLNIMPPFM